MGPLALADLIGLDTCLAIMETLYNGFKDSKYRPCPLLRKYVEAGWLAEKPDGDFLSIKKRRPYAKKAADSTPPSSDKKSRKFAWIRILRWITSPMRRFFHRSPEENRVWKNHPSGRGLASDFPGPENRFRNPPQGRAVQPQGSDQGLYQANRSLCLHDPDSGGRKQAFEGIPGNHRCVSGASCVGYHHEGEEFVYVLSGKIEIVVGEHINKLETGRYPAL